MTTQAQPRRRAVPLTVFSPAKVNLHLRIVGKRPDGYHELETVMLPLDFGDEMVFTRPEPLIETDGWRGGNIWEDAGLKLALICRHPELEAKETRGSGRKKRPRHRKVQAVESNLAARAAILLAKRLNVDQGATIYLRKRTPLGAGLGGGSSNAAAVLLGLKQLWGLQADDSILHELAASMGSDVNFFLGDGAAFCRGRGERIEPVACKFTGAILLVNPGFGISTKWAYENWAKASAVSRLTVNPPEVSLLLRALAEDDLAGVSHCLFNSLEAPSIRKFPVLALIKNAMREDGAAGALMSGSGATVFGLFTGAEVAERSAQRIREQFGPSMWTQVTRFAKSRPLPGATRKTAR